MADIRTLTSLAIIDHLWDTNRDLIEVYSLMAIPALVEAHANHPKTIDAVGLRDFFHNHYGLKNITAGATTKFLDNLAKRHAAVYRKDHKYMINTSGLAKIQGVIDETPDLSIDINRIITDIIGFAKDTHDEVLIEDEVSAGLVEFFDRNAGALSIEQKDINAIAIVRYKNPGHKQKVKYIISEYIRKLNNDNSKDFEILLKFAIGHQVASAITFQTLPDYDPSLKGLTLYIDAPLIFNLLGLSGDVPKRLAEELLSILRDRKARLILASHHYGEVIGAINHAINLLNSDPPDQTKINRIYNYAVETNLTSSDLEILSQQVRAVCESKGIEVLNTPLKESGYSEFSVDDIYEVIIDVFESGSKYSLSQHRKDTVKRDAKVLKDVFSLRYQPTNNKLKDAGAILVTNNTGLCVAVSDSRLSPNACVYPAAILTENLSMIMWLEAPTRDSELQRLLIIDQCMKALKPRVETIRMFYIDIKQKHANNQISDSDYKAAISSKVVRKLLSELTFNDNNMYTDATALQVIDRLKRLSEVEVSNQEIHLKKIADGVARSLCVFVAMILGGLAIVNTFCKHFLPNWISYLLGGFFCLWCVLSWINIIPSKNTLETRISSAIYKRLTPPK